MRCCIHTPISRAASTTKTVSYQNEKGDNAFESPSDPYDPRLLAAEPPRTIKAYGTTIANHFHAPRLHRRPACRAARHRVICGAWLADGVGDGGNFRGRRHAWPRNNFGSGAGVAIASGIAEVESHFAAGSHHARRG